MLENLPAFLGEHWVTLIGFVLSGVFGVLGTLFFRKQIRPKIQRLSFQIIGEENFDISAGLEIFYNKTKIKRLTRTIIIFWNDGKEVLHGDAVADSGKIGFHFTEGERILSSQIVAKTREANKAFIDNDPEHKHIANLGFDFLDSKDGVTIEFLHTDKDRYPSVIGVIKGAPHGIRNTGQDINEGFPLSKKYSAFISERKRKNLVLGSSVVIAALGLFVYDRLANVLLTGLDSKERIFFLVGFGVYILSLSSATALWVNRRRYPKALRYSETDP